MSETEKLIPKSRFMGLVIAHRLMKERNASARGEYGHAIETIQADFPGYDRQAGSIALKFDLKDRAKAEHKWRHLKYLVEECLGLGAQGDLEDLADETEDTQESADAPSLARLKLALAGADSVESVRAGVDAFLSLASPASRDLVERAYTEGRYRLTTLGLDADQLVAPARPRRGRKPKGEADEGETRAA